MECSASKQEQELLELQRAIRSKLDSLSGYLPRDLRAKRDALARAASGKLEQLDSILAQRRKLKQRIRALQIGIAGQEELTGGEADPQTVDFFMPSPERSLRRTSVVSNVFIDLNLIPEPQEWNSEWMERLCSLTACDLTLLHKQHICRLLQCTSLPEGKKQEQMAHMYGHYHRISRRMRDLIPTVWTQRGEYDMEMFMPLGDTARPSPQAMYQRFLSMTTEEERECLLFLYREYKAKLADIKEAHAALVARNNKILETCVTDYRLGQLYPASTAPVSQCHSDQDPAPLPHTHVSSQPHQSPQGCTDFEFSLHWQAQPQANSPHSSSTGVGLECSHPTASSNLRRAASDQSDECGGHRDTMLELSETTALLRRNLKRQHDLGKLLWRGVVMMFPPDRLLAAAVSYAPIVINTLDFCLAVMAIHDERTAAANNMVAH